MMPLETPPSGLRKVFLIGGGLLGFLLVTLLGLIFLTGPKVEAPSGLRAPSGYVETEFARRMEKGGHEVAYFSGQQVSVLVKDAEWKRLGEQDRYARLRFLSDAKASLVAVQRERGDKSVYTMSVKSAENRRVLAEETDFNPKVYD
ncbi:MAG TPA: hypothetical protein V6D05_07770 [Stenomitos sp.]